MLQSPSPMLRGLDCLLQAPFLAGVDIAELERIPLRRVEFGAGEWVFTARSSTRDLFLVAGGSIEILEGARGAQQRRLGRALAGDVIGEHRLGRRPPRWAARAESAAVLFRWPQDDLETFLGEHPEAQGGLVFLTESRRLAGRMRPSWLGEDEVIHGLARKHPAILVRALLLPAVLLSSGMGLLAMGGLGGQGGLAMGGAALAAFAAAFAVWRAVDWRNDYYVVTDHRVVWLEKVVGLYDNRLETPLRMILSVSVGSGLMGRQLDFGDVEVRTYTGSITFESAPHPGAFAAAIESLTRRLQRETLRADRQVIQESLRQRLESGPLPEPTRPLRPSAEDEERDLARAGLDHWSFQSRFVEAGVITYRKHLAVLVQALLLPTLLLAAILALGGAAAAGLVAYGASRSFYPVLGVSGVAAVLWWLYEYADWANELFQVTPTHIVSVHKRPLGRESRKVAPLENILGTEVDRRGPLGILLNFGDVVAAVGNATFIFDGVLNPSAAQQDIVRAQEALVDQKQQTERKRRQDEMVEWLAAYHEQTSPPTAPDKTDPIPP